MTSWSCACRPGPPSFEAANERLREEVRERSQAEERLAASEQRYRQVIELIREALWIHCDGRIVFANSAAAQMFGAGGLAQLTGARSGHHRSARPRPRQRAHEDPARCSPPGAADGNAAAAHRRPPAGDEIQAVPFDHEGRPAVLAVARDITLRKDIEEQLRQSRRWRPSASSPAASPTTSTT